MNQNNNNKKILLKKKKRLSIKESIGQMMPERQDKTSLF